MKNNLFICFFFFCALTFSQSEREIINQIDSINALALHHYNTNDVVQSFNNFNESAKLSDSIKDHYGNAVANFSLGKIYSYMQEFEEAEKRYTIMLEQAQLINDNFLIANSYVSLGEMFKQSKKSDDVIPYFEKALVFASKSDVKDQNNKDKQQSVLFNIEMNLSNVYLDKNEPKRALTHLLRAENNLNQLPLNLYSKGYLNYTYGLYFMNKQSYNLANNKFKEAVRYLERNNKFQENTMTNFLISNIYKKLSISLEELNKNDVAYEFLLKHNSYREKFLNEEKVKQGNIAKAKFFLAQYKHAAVSANKERVLQEAISNKIKIVSLITSIAVIILFISFLISFKNYRSKQKLSEILRARNVQLEIAKNQAEKSSQLKTKFISNVTHELRTPLYGVVGLTSLLLNSNDLSEKDGKYLKSLKYSGDYLLNLVNDILQIGKMESEKVELKNVSVNLKALIENIVSSFENRLQETNNQMQFLVDDGIPQLIKCDQVRLTQVLINLIGNSIKFTESGKIDLRVKMLDLNEDNVSLSFEIEDNGPGIPKKMHKKIFENFTQLDENNNINYQGTGLGLSIVKKLVGLFGSQVELESEIGKGSTFRFNVDFKIDQDKKVEVKKLKNNSVTLNEGRKILVAEDNKINQIVTQNLLKKAGYECVVVKNGLEAVAAVKNTAFDLILMDINMPLMNGNEATAAIRELDSSIPIIALTAADIEEVKRDYLEIGYNDVITKPFDNYEFFQTIATYIEQGKSDQNYDVKLEKVS